MSTKFQRLCYVFEVGIMTALMRILSYVRVSGLSKMAAYNRKCLRNNVYLDKFSHDPRPQKHRYSRRNFVAIICTSWATRYCICTSGHRPPSLICHSPRHMAVLRLVQSCWKHRYSRWNFVAILYTSWDIRYFVGTPGSRPPSLIYHFPWHRTVFAQDQSWCTPSKT